MHHVLCRVFLRNRFGTLQLLAFPKTKSTFDKRFQTVDEIQENTIRKLMAIGRTVWGPKVPTLKGTEASLSFVQCFLYLVSSSINVSIFHITWLDTFWVDLVYSSSFLSLLKYSVLCFFFWPQVFFQNMIFSLHKILQSFYLFQPFSFVSIWRHLSFCLFSLEESRLWYTSLHIYLFEHLWSFLQTGSWKWNHLVKQHMSRPLKSTATLPTRSTAWSTLLLAVCLFLHPGLSLPWASQELFLRMTFVWACHHPCQMRNELRGITVPLCSTSMYLSPPLDQTENIIN